MPLYLYTNERLCKTIERIFSMNGRIPRKVKHKGSNYLRNIPAEHKGRKPHPGNWPLWSTMGGCSPDCVDQVRKDLAVAGVKAEFNSEGDVKWESRGHRRAYLKARGLRDNDGGYGDG